MFSFFSKTPSPQTPPLIQTDDTVKNQDGKVQVFVWPGGFMDGLGHVALQLEDDPKEYASIWPKLTPAGGLTAVLPLTATFCKTLEGDCMQEARRPPEDFSNLLEPTTLTPIEPTVYTIVNLDVKKMKAELHRLEKDVENGEVSYQLLPGITVAGLFSRFLPNNKPEKEVYNCVTLTQHLLKEGGMNNLQVSPWTTPAKLGLFLEKPKTIPDLPSSQENNASTSRLMRLSGYLSE